MTDGLLTRLAQRVLGGVPVIGPVTAPVFIAGTEAAGRPGRAASTSAPPHTHAAEEPAGDRSPAAHPQLATPIVDGVAPSVNEAAGSDPPPREGVTWPSADPLRVPARHAQPPPAPDMRSSSERARGGDASPTPLVPRELRAVDAEPGKLPPVPQPVRTRSPVLTRSLPDRALDVRPASVEPGTPLPMSPVADDPRPRRASESQRYVTVTIGRIDIHAVSPTPAPKPMRKPARSAPAMTLDDYMKQRSSGRR